MDSCHGSSLKLSRFWTRSLRSWEIEEIERLEFVINQSRMSEGKDSLSWSVSKKNSYVVEKATELFQQPWREVPWQFIWKLKIPHKIKVFLRKFHLNIIPTRSLLLAREIISHDGAWCLFCKKSIETSEHLFFQCYTSTFCGKRFLHGGISTPSKLIQNI